MAVVIAKYLKGEGGGGCLTPFNDEPIASTLSREALHGCACNG